MLGGAHPLTKAIEDDTANARAKLRARETPSPSEDNQRNAAK